MISSYSMFFIFFIAILTGLAYVIKITFYKVRTILGDQKLFIHKDVRFSNMKKYMALINN
jgi:hypothetical protein